MLCLLCTFRFRTACLPLPESLGHPESMNTSLFHPDGPAQFLGAKRLVQVSLSRRPGSSASCLHSPDCNQVHRLRSALTSGPHIVKVVPNWSWPHAVHCRKRPGACHQEVARRKLRNCAAGTLRLCGSCAWRDWGFETSLLVPACRPLPCLLCLQSF
jgi:hypothetical protein